MTARPLPSDDASVQVILDALAFVTAAGHGDHIAAVEVLARADRDAGPDGFPAALAATVQLLIDEAAADGVDLTAAVRDVALGVQLAHAAEHPDDAT